MSGIFIAIQHKFSQAGLDVDFEPHGFEFEFEDAGMNHKVPEG